MIDWVIHRFGNVKHDCPGLYLFGPKSSDRFFEWAGMAKSNTPPLLRDSGGALDLPPFAKPTTVARELNGQCESHQILLE